MNIAEPRVYINGVEIPAVALYDINITYSIETHLPKGLIILDDADSALLQRFNFAIGSFVNISYIEADNYNKNKKDTLINWGVLVITKIFHDNQLSPSELGGYLTLEVAHPWELYRDYSPHAYGCQKISELVKKIIQDDTRGMAFDLESKYVGTTDDKGNYPRYKVNESDYDFILNKLLPYSSIGGDPVHFFVDESGYVHYNNLKSMLTSSVVGLITPSDTGDEKSGEMVKSQLSNSGGFYYGFNDFTVSIGGGSEVNYIQSVKPKIYVEDIGTHKNIMIAKTATSYISKTSGKNSGNKIPIFVGAIAGSPSTNSYAFINRSADDQAGLSTNAIRNSDKIFRINVNVPFTGLDTPVGSCVNVFAAIPHDKRMDVEGKSKSHWLCGKWVVYQATHKMMKPKAPETGMATQLVLVRPTFVINSDTTSIMNPNIFWSIV